VWIDAISHIEVDPMHEALLDAGACGAPPLFMWAACSPPNPKEG
jgi:hypothetical protein